ncbi:hypothetical membrane protein [Thermoplasma acidophilum]|uniref:Hypothetical membrane protein n=2 Tax=Thermoplasma acidophilum TaxID=2303 RepID=Q9HIZ2_THEAC|nr:hypothetical membrane protein [Thermoplasma acidophilum]
MIAAAALSSLTSIGMTEALRIGAGSATVGGFSFFIAEYARLRGEVFRMSRQLAMDSPRRLMRSRIGVEITEEALEGTAIAGVSGFLGSMIPLATDALLPDYHILPFSVAIIALAFLGIGLARSISGNYTIWAVGMSAVGIVMSYVGIFLHIVS